MIISVLTNEGKAEEASFTIDFFVEENKEDDVTKAKAPASNESVKSTKQFSSSLQ